MAPVEPAPPTLAEAPATQCQTVFDAVKTEAANLKDVKQLRMLFFDKDTNQVAADKLNDKSPPILAKVCTSKASSFLRGDTLVSPGACKTCCCLFMPWMCGCTKLMPVRGVVSCEVAGTSVVGVAVSGAPTGDADLQLIEAALAVSGFTKDGEGKWAAGKDGAAGSVVMERD